MATRRGGASEAVRHAMRHLRARLSLAITGLVGLAAMALLPGAPGLVTRSLVGWNFWNSATWLYLLLVLATMLHTDHERLRPTALAKGRR
jgi:uncharacterized membrane protein